MKKTLLAIFACVTTLASGQTLVPVSSEAWLGFLTPSEHSAFVLTGNFLDSGTTIDGLKLANRGPWATDVAQAWAGRATTVTAELLTLIPDNNATATLPERLLRAFNAMNAVSTMKGTQYWSTMRKDWETLILESYRVASPQKSARLPDETFSAVPDHLDLTVFQKDNKLGDGFTQISIQTKPDGFFVTMNNIDPLNYFFVTLVGPRQFQMTFDITFLKNKIAIYTLMGAKTIQFFGLEHSKDKSFRNRMEALAGWFAKSL